MSKIVIVLPRGEAIRNFVYSGCAKSVMQQAEVHVISVKPNERIWKELQQHCHELHELKPVKENRKLLYLRDWIDTVHGRHLWSEAAKVRWKLRWKEAQTLSQKLKLAVKRGLGIPFRNKNGLRFLTSLEHSLYKKLTPENQYTKLLRELKPNLLFNGSHIHSVMARAVVHEAKKLKIPTATFLFSWDNLTSQGRIMPQYDHYLVWSENIHRDLGNIYPHIKPSQISVTGTPQFDFHFDPRNIIPHQEFFNQMGLDPQRPVLLYTTGMMNLMPYEERVVERIADIVAGFPDPKPQLLVRVYPKDTTGRFEKLRNSRKDIHVPHIPWAQNHLTPLPEDLPLWTSMLYYCDIGINVASTVSLELCMFDKPVLNIGFNPAGVEVSPKDYGKYYSFDHYRPLTESGALDIVYKEDDFVPVLKELLEKPKAKAIQRKALLESFFGTYLDGNCGERIAHKLIELAK